MSGFKTGQAGAETHFSPNFGPRRNIGGVDAIILHYTGMESGAAAEDWLCNPESRVSSHYIVHEDGRVVQMVCEGARAWHAGKSSWHGETDINSLSVGIEIVNPGHAFGYPDFPDVQIAAVIDLCRGVMDRHEIAAHRVLAHSDVAPGRKIDPGEKFPWRRLADEGVGHFVAPAPIRQGRCMQKGAHGADVERVQEMLASYGYEIARSGGYDAETITVVAAFQRHFRPSRVDGTADLSTVRTLGNLLDTLPSGAVPRGQRHS